MLRLRNSPIPLEPSFLAVHGREQIETELKRIVCGVRFELTENEKAVRLLGPDMSYHRVDPYLPGYLRRMGLAPEDILSFKSRTEHADFCFEDCWTGYFIADCLNQHRQGDELTIIHLDGHSDMMATLLCLSEDLLTDPTSGAVFDPACSSDWRSAIYSGSIAIGNYMTPLYYSSSRIHIRHLTNCLQRSGGHSIARESRRYELIPNMQFAAITKVDSTGAGAVGSYFVAPNPERVLDEKASDWTLIHIDLDYFINDFNGSTREVGYVPGPALRTRAAKRMNRFFEALANVGPSVDRWIIATSPGFCSAYHWEWLLSEIDLHIREYENAAT
jgi:hypothetical protein